MPAKKKVQTRRPVRTAKPKGLIRIAPRLTSDDVTHLRKRAKLGGRSVSDLARVLLHRAIEQESHPLFAFKFIIREHEPRDLPPHMMPEGVVGKLTYSACVAVAVAHTVEEAREILLDNGRRTGGDLRWVVEGCCEKITQLTLDQPCFLMDAAL